MNASVADQRTVEAYARQLVADHRDSRVLVLAADPQYRGPQSITVDDQEVRVYGCVSSLAIRQALAELPDHAFAVLLTDRPLEDLGDSLVARFHRQRLEPLDLWATVPGMFAGRSLDIGLRRDLSWLPHLLLQRMPISGYHPSPTDVVTRDHILGCLAAAVLQVPADDVAPGALLDAFDDLRLRQAWTSLEPAARQVLSAWAGRRSGAAAAGVLTLAGAQSLAHLNITAFGLMLNVMYGPPDPSPEIRQARRGWEQGHQLPRITEDAAAQIGVAARSRALRLGSSDPAARQTIWRDTGEAFAVVAFPQGIALSPSHPDGYAARASEVARAVATSLRDQGPCLDSAVERLREHDLAALDFAGDAERAEMAARLVRWLGRAYPPPTTLADALQRQVSTDGWVDRALADVWSGSLQPDVAESYRALCDRVLQVRREHDRQFANLLQDASRGDLLPADVQPVEGVLHDIVRAIAQRSPVLLLVIDGMSAAVAAAIGEGINRLAFQEYTRTGHEGRLPVLAALPTMTRFSRTSLLCGTLRDGNQSDEKRAFAAVTRGRLFHKDDLRAPAGSAVNQAVADTIGSADRVVGVVLNTVDDTLAKHDPDGTRWSVAAVQHLDPLLDLARRDGRTVILTSDHGHVVERGGRAEPHELADTRWRPAATGGAGGPGPDEVLLQGPRVIPAGGSIIAPWAEDLRYGRKAAGYHGGAAAAEVTIPLLVFAPRGMDLEPAGWEPAGAQAPNWWDRGAVPVAVPPAAPAAPGRKTRPARGQESLFEPPAEPTEPPVVPTDPFAAPIADFLASPGYLRTRGSTRAPMSDATVAEVLRLLLRGRGRASEDELARVLGISPRRVKIQLAPLRNVFNVEGYQVLSTDSDGRTVRLDIALWRQQFGIAD